jgi:hypothetical protein
MADPESTPPEAPPSTGAKSLFPGFHIEPAPRPDAADLSAWFEENQAKDRCPICDNDTWNPVSSEPDMTGGAIPVLRPSGEMFNAHFRVIVLICSRCYFVRSHLYNAFQVWLAERNKSKPPP